MTFDINRYNVDRLQAYVDTQAGRFAAVVSKLRPWLDHLNAIPVDKATILGLDLARALHFTNDATAAVAVLDRMRELVDGASSQIPPLLDVSCRLQRMQTESARRQHKVVIEEAALALDTLRRVGNPAPQYAEILWMKGIALSELSQHGEALSTYDQALSALSVAEIPNDLSNSLLQLSFKIKNSRCVSLTQLGRGAEALAELERQIRAYEEAYRVRPDANLMSQLASKYGNHVTCLLKAGEFRAALSAVDRYLPTLVSVASGTAVTQAKFAAVREHLKQMRTAAAQYVNLLDQAEQGEAQALMTLGNLLMTGRGLDPAPVAALKWFLVAAEKGLADAQYNVAQIWNLGAGVTRDVKKARSWWDRAAKQGHAESQFNLYTLYLKGDGVERDVGVAITWLRRAAASGELTAQRTLAARYRYGQDLPKDPLQAAHWFLKAANAGDAGAQVDLGQLYMSGEAVVKDEGAAVEWWRKAADKGIASAQHNLAVAYRLGTGVSKDQSEAAAWFRKAADQGFSAAQWALAHMYRFGEGVETSIAEAAMWAERADQTSPAAPDQQQRNPLDLRFIIPLACCAEKDVSEEVAQKVAAWVERAAQRGYAGAQNGIAYMYLAGKGVKKDLDVAASWADRAEKQGHGELGLLVQIAVARQQPND